MLIDTCYLFSQAGAAERVQGTQAGGWLEGYGTVSGRARPTTDQRASGWIPVSLDELLVP